MPDALSETIPLVATAPVVAELTFSSEPVVRATPVLLMFTPTPVVNPLAATFTAFPAVVLAELTFNTFAAPVVELPVMLTTLPV